MRCIGFDEHFADNGVQDCGCCGALEVVAKGMVGGVDLVWRINDWMEIVFFAEALECGTDFEMLPLHPRFPLLTKFSGYEHIQTQWHSQQIRWHICP